MAIINWNSDTNIEYIFDYGENIADINGEQAIISRSTDGLKFFGKKLDGNIFEINIQATKKPNDQGGTGDFFMNTVIQKLSKDQLSNLAEKIKALI